MLSKILKRERNTTYGDLLKLCYVRQVSPKYPSHLVQLRDIVCGENAIVKEGYYGTLKAVQWSAVVNSRLVQNKVDQKQRTLFGPVK